MYPYTLDLIYLVTSVMFIIGIKMLSTPAAATRGNYLSAIAMLVTVGVTLVTSQIVDWVTIWAGVAVGTAIGIVASRMVQMTAMPQMVALYNGFGGLASALVALSEYDRQHAALTPYLTSVILLSLIVGNVTFTGSVVAYAKLQELMPGRPMLFRGQHWINLILLLVTLGGGAYMTAYDPLVWNWFFALGAIALVLGVLVVIPIGGADMPVVIALLNSYSGIAVSFTGFVLNNNVLIIAGSLVGASGIFLTNAMCVAMNRSVWNVLFGGFGQTAPAGAGAAAGPGGDIGAVKAYTIEDAVNVFESAQSVIFVPGYGMAAAQAQHAVRDLADHLQQAGLNVRYAIHPVAGRMPGHMNVLLAEANVPYDLLCDMEQINDDFKNTDVAVVVGANDVVNPAANDDPGSPIYGMPILNVEQTRTVMVLKRSMNPGFAGIENALFLRDNTMMLFGDAKATLTKLAEALKHR
ncbi:MAG: NAD(P)(+) transhydrogenase (Re/Si-specific) subunit beta [Candidatus Lambdaproteobacteria bacterium]|nr:NAD(P)(+) transhydrogenase (Re/Si-specific) subunit beta [Candidatus Lambdaproteobacteria bacterium]